MNCAIKKKLNVKEQQTVYALAKSAMEKRTVIKKRLCGVRKLPGITLCRKEKWTKSISYSAMSYGHTLPIIKITYHATHERY
jgi:hypothetical protein